MTLPAKLSILLDDEAEQGVEDQTNNHRNQIEDYIAPTENKKQIEDYIALTEKKIKDYIAPTETK